MKESSSIKKNYFYSLLYQALIMLLPLITAPYLSRIIGTEGIGIYTYLYSITQYFIYFGLLGISNYGNRNIAKFRDDPQLRNKLFSSIYTLQIITVSTSIIAYLIYCTFFISSSKDIAFLLLFFIISSLFDISWFFWGMENFKITVTKQIFVKIITTLAIFIFIKTPSDLWLYTLILSGGTLLGQAYLFVNLKKYVSFKYIPPQESFIHFKAVFILAIPIIATSIYRTMDKIMIGTLSNMSEVGYYEYSDKLTATCMGFIGALGAVMLPKMANLVSKGDREQQEKYFKKSFEITMFIAFAIACGIFSISDVFIPFFYGNEFYPSINVTRILCLCVPFISWACVVRTQYLIPNEKDNIYVISIILGAVVNIICNVFLIPLYGSYGAAIGTLCAESLVMLKQTIYCSRELHLLHLLKLSMPFLFIGLIMLLLVRIVLSNFGYSIAGMFISIIIGGTIYLLFSIGYLYITKNELILMIITKFRYKLSNMKL